MKHFKEPTDPERYPSVSFKQESFGPLYKDIPYSEIPNNALAWAVNVLQFDKYFEVRPGTKLWAEPDYPALKGQFQTQSQYERPQSNLPHIPLKNNYAATKTGYLITKTAGVDFSPSDVGNYFVWPDNSHDYIASYIDANNIMARLDDTRSPCTAENPGKIRGAINRWFWHKKSRKVFWHIANQVFWTDYRMVTFHEIYSLSAAVPTNEKSFFDAEKDRVYLWTTNGIFFIDTLADPIEMYKVNEPVPDNNIQGKEQTKERIIGRRYLNTMSILTGTGNRNRGDEGVAIRKETGPNKIRKENNYNDYKEVFWAYQILESHQTGQISRYVECGAAGALSNFTEIEEPLQGIHITARTWRGPAVARDIAFDLRNVASYDEIASIIQEVMRETFPDIAPYCECRFFDDHFIFTCGPEDDTTMNAVAPVAAALLDVSGVNYINIPGAPNIFTSGIHVIEGVDESDNALMIPPGQTQWTHYTLYGTKNTNKPENNPEAYVFMEDVPVAKSFIANYEVEVTPAGNVTSRVRIVGNHNKFELHDIGSFIKFENGFEFEIMAYDNDELVVIGYEPIGGVYIYPPTVLPHYTSFENVAACIGGGDIRKAYQSGDTVHRISGDIFKPSDLRKRLFWSDGTYGLCVEFIDEDTIRVSKEEEKGTSLVPLALTMNPTGRNFNDTITDTALGYRFKSLPLQNRFWSELPSGDTGNVVSGWLFSATKGENDITYSQLPLNAEYLGGHYYSEFQNQRIKDAIRSIREFPGSLVIFCANSTWRIQTNVSDILTTPEVGEAIAVVTGIDLVDQAIGIQHEGSLQPLENGSVACITSEPQVRIFDGYQYGEALCNDKDGKSFILNDIQKLQPEVSVGYDPLMGYIIWGTEIPY